MTQHTVWGIAFTLIVCAGAPAAETLSGRVASVSNGDTFVIMDQTNTARTIELSEVDAPESTQAFSEGARLALIEKVQDKDVTVTYTPIPEHDRIRGKVMCEKRWINRDMVADGWAWHVREESSNWELARSEKEARRERRGLWQDPTPTAPWIYREEAKREAAFIQAWEADVQEDKLNAGKKTSEQSVAGGKSGKQQVSKSGKSGKQQVSKSGNSGKQQVSKSGNSGKQQVSKSGKSGKQQAGKSGNSGKQQVSKSGKSGKQQAGKSGKSSKQQVSKSGNSGKQQAGKSGNSGKQQVSKSGKSGKGNSTARSSKNKQKNSGKSSKSKSKGNSKSGGKSKGKSSSSDGKSKSRLSF